MHIKRNTDIPFSAINDLCALVRQHIQSLDPLAEFDERGTIRALFPAITGGGPSMYIGVASKDDTPVGLLLGHVTLQPLEAGPLANAILLHVDTTRAEAGTGTALLEDFTAWATERHAAVVRVEVSMASGMPDLRAYRQVSSAYCKRIVTAPITPEPSPAAGNSHG